MLCKQSRTWFSAAAALLCLYATATAQSLQQKRYEADRDLANAATGIGQIVMAPLLDEAKIKDQLQRINSMNKPRLDAFAELLTVCSSRQVCGSQLENYRLKFGDADEEPIINALQVVNNSLVKRNANASFADSAAYFFP